MAEAQAGRMAAAFFVSLPLTQSQRAFRSRDK
jgi:hypothetical protein